MVAVQLKTLMAEGTPMKKVRKEKDQGGVNRHSGDEHVVRPDEEAENGDGYARQGGRTGSRRCVCARSRR